MSFRTHLSVAGFGLAGVYAAVGVVELLLVGDPGAAFNFGVAAVVTGALVAVLLPLLAPRGGSGPESDDGDDGPGGGGGDGGDRPPPPWWPVFEREFWSYVEKSPPAESPPTREDVAARR